MKESSKPVVLFLCTQNAARSQMAEAILRNLAGDRFEVASAGLKPTTIHPLTRLVMNEIGLSLVGQESKPISQFLGKARVSYAIIVCNESEASCPELWPFCSTVLSWPFEDPSSAAGDDSEKIKVFRRVRDQVHQKIKLWLDDLATN